jgi:hypothetical protein
MSSSKHQEQLHGTPQAPASGLAPNSTKLELNNPNRLLVTPASKAICAPPEFAPMSLDLLSAGAGAT